MGGLASVETPELFGPRNAGQAGVAPPATEAAATANKQKSATDFISQKSDARLTLKQGLALDNLKAPRFPTANHANHPTEEERLFVGWAFESASAARPVSPPHKSVASREPLMIEYLRLQRTHTGFASVA